MLTAVYGQVGSRQLLMLRICQSSLTSSDTRFREGDTSGGPPPNGEGVIGLAASGGAPLFGEGVIGVTASGVPIMCGSVALGFAASAVVGKISVSTEDRLRSRFAFASASASAAASNVQNIPTPPSISASQRLGCTQVCESEFRQ
mmetsp:Transcript_91361/g.181610  ORF Transcript_91361/g.181610 Transcript_91361/m.181610 type:complete len:145 (-) Transcript_91361:1763-2197(-)